MNDSFPELLKPLEEIGYLLENFDFDVHNDEDNVEHVESAKLALENLTSAIEDLVP